VVIKQRAQKHDGRVRDTRQRILQEAEQLYYRGGYAGISLQELADLLELSKAALFHHFKSKQELFFETLLEMLEGRRQHIKDAIAQGSDTSARLRNVMRALSNCPFFDPMKFLTEEKGNLSADQQREIDAAFYRSIQQPIAQVLEEGVRCGDLRPHPPLLGVMVFLNLVMLLPSPGHPNTRLGQHMEPPQYLDELLDIFLQGVGAPQSAGE
jgi:TetR/AcrR family transcriptional regulator, cholesterol catabolism regulator